MQFYCGWLEGRFGMARGERVLDRWGFLNELCWWRRRLTFARENAIDRRQSNVSSIPDTYNKVRHEAIQQTIRTALSSRRSAKPRSANHIHLGNYLSHRCSCATTSCTSSTSSSSLSHPVSAPLRTRSKRNKDRKTKIAPITMNHLTESTHNSRMNASTFYCSLLF